MKKVYRTLAYSGGVFYGYETVSPHFIQRLINGVINAPLRIKVVFQDEDGTSFVKISLNSGNGVTESLVSATDSEFNAIIIKMLKYDLLSFLECEHKEVEIKFTEEDTNFKTFSELMRNSTDVMIENYTVEEHPEEGYKEFITANFTFPGLNEAQIFIERDEQVTNLIKERCKGSKITE